MQTEIVKDGPRYRQDKRSDLYKKVVELAAGESLVIKKVTEEEYKRLRVYFAFKKNAVRSKYLFDMAFSKGIRFSVHAKLNSDCKYTIWIRKETDDTAT